jgi:hypothetical protein
VSGAHHGRGESLFERRRRLPDAVAPPVERLPHEVERQLQPRPGEVRQDADIGRATVNVGPLSSACAHSVDDGVLQLEGDETGVGVL